MLKTYAVRWLLVANICSWDFAAVKTQCIVYCSRFSHCNLMSSGSYNNMHVWYKGTESIHKSLCYRSSCNSTQYFDHHRESRQIFEDEVHARWLKAYVREFEKSITILCTSRSCSLCRYCYNTYIKFNRLHDWLFSTTDMKPIRLSCIGSYDPPREIANQSWYVCD